MLLVVHQVCCRNLPNNQRGVHGLGGPALQEDLLHGDLDRQDYRHAVRHDVRQDDRHVARRDVLQDNRQDNLQDVLLEGQQDDRQDNLQGDQQGDLQGDQLSTKQLLLPVLHELSDLDLNHKFVVLVQCLGVHTNELTRGSATTTSVQNQLLLVRTRNE